MNNELSINLPQKIFKMRANLAVKEEFFLTEWKKLNIYLTFNFFNSKKKFFFLHDGPPYANGQIHLGHALNKILKDFILKYKRLSGYTTKFILGWDCHGLPIELKIKFSDEKKNFLQNCKKYALSQIDIQKNDLYKLGIVTNWNNYYLTMNYNYISNIIKSLIEIVKNDYLIYEKNFIYWCNQCLSTLSESELIKKKILIQSMYVQFKISNYYILEKLFSLYKINYNAIKIIVFINKPWLLPLFESFYINPNKTYFLILHDQNIYILNKKLYNIFFKKKNIIYIGKCKGIYINNIYIYNPFQQRNILILHYKNKKNINILTYHSNNNIDFLKKNNIKILNTLNKNGNYQLINNFLYNKNIFHSFYNILNFLRNKNLYLKKIKKIKNYSLCWRHNKPIFFRIKWQWFINLNKNNIKKKIINKINELENKTNKKFLLIKNLILKRPNWCISRQRNWGVSIPFFINKITKKVHPNIINFLIYIANKIKKNKTNLIKNYNINFFINKKEIKNYIKVTDILDIWFDSGVSIFSYENKFNRLNQSDLVLEGKDQYRGWFMSSIILSIIINNNLPFKDIISHGFILDKNKIKMSKSLNNIITPQNIIKQHGADILRMWISLNNYKKDIIFSNENINFSINIYIKIRNTLKFLISNINKKDFIYLNKKINLLSFDRWILNKMINIQKKIIFYFNKNNFNKVILTIFNFCNKDLSVIYFDMIKDRLYLYNKKNICRISCILTIIHIINYMIRWIFPILSFTSYEIWNYLPYNKITLFNTKWYKLILNKSNYYSFLNNILWKKILILRKKIFNFLEKLKTKKIIKTFYNLKIYIYCDIDWYYLLLLFNKELKYLFFVSEIKILLIKKKKFIIFYKTLHNLNKCIRCSMKMKKLLKNNICKECIYKMFYNKKTRYFI